jgi:hypothetical protein
MNNLTEQDIKNLLAIIAIANIKGSEALTVAILQKKLESMLTPVAEDVPNVVTETSPNEKKPE